MRWKEERGYLRVAVKKYQWKPTFLTNCRSSNKKHSFLHRNHPGDTLQSDGIAYSWMLCYHIRYSSSFFYMGLVSFGSLYLISYSFRSFCGGWFFFPVAITEWSFVSVSVEKHKIASNAIELFSYLILFFISIWKRKYRIPCKYREYVRKGTLFVCILPQTAWNM